VKEQSAMRKLAETRGQDRLASQTARPSDLIRPLACPPGRYCEAIQVQARDLWSDLRSRI
jgi:hypothetical protein